jgi:membrane protease YdiL (CAAX protease family)
MEPAAMTLLQRLFALRPMALTFLFYVLLSQLAQTLLYTVITYMVSLSSKTGPDFSNSVNEISGQYILFTFALAAFLLALTIWQADRALYRQVPFWNSPHRPVWQLDHVRKEELLRGLSNGGLCALVYLLFFSLTGQIDYLGVYITSAFGTPVFPLFFMDVLGLATLVACEEFLFRHKILRGLLARMPVSLAILCTAALHTLARHWQFQLEPLDYANLLCLNLILGYLYVRTGKCHRGLGLILSLLCVLHTVGGLPLWGFESPSVFLLKAAPRTPAWTTGGASGPLAGAGLFAVIALFTLVLTWRRDLEARRQSERAGP